MQTLTIETVTVERRIGGYVTETHEAVRDIPAPFRIGKRWTIAHARGLAFVRSLGVQPVRYARIDGVINDAPRTGVVFVAVLDSQRRQLAAWRLMDDGHFTGTHDGHPAIPARSPFYRA